MESPTNIDEVQKQKYRIGINVLIALGIFTVMEFAISMFGITWVWVFIIIALVKAFLVLRDYMHVGRLFKGEEH